MIFVILMTGGGGTLIVTVEDVNSSTTPLVLYTVSALLTDGSPGNPSLLVELDVSLNELDPFWNLNTGAGIDKGSLKKNDPNISPNLSVTNLISDTVATAPLR